MLSRAALSSVSASAAARRALPAATSAVFSSHAVTHAAAGSGGGGAGETEETYTSRMERMHPGRPVSPHVSIYAFPVTAISSIMNRGAGVALYGGVSALGALALVGVDVPAMMAVLGSDCGMLVGAVAKFSVGFPLIYHGVASVRHMIWDEMPETLENDQVAQTSNLVIAGSAAAAAGLMFF